MGIVSSFRKVVRIKHMQKKGEEGVTHSKQTAVSWTIELMIEG